jgi:hypothetical protein
LAYGPTAFGLRLGAWIAKKKPDLLLHIAILGFARLRRTSDLLLPSEKIGALADQAEVNWKMSLKLKELARTRPEFRYLFTPKRFRQAFQDQSALNRFLKEIEAARQCD